MGVPMLLVLSMALFALPVVGQWRAPRPERKSARALAVLEIYPNGARRLVPVTLFYEGRYYNAALYRAAPTPFTLSPATVYEVQRFGKPLGTFTVWSAARIGESAWVGNGVYRALPDPATLAKAKKAAAPVVVEDPSRPVLHRHEGSEGDLPGAKQPTSASDEEDPERPRLHRREEPASKSGSSVSDSSISDASQSQTDQQANRSAADAVAASALPPPEAGVDHPVLRRGKPQQEQSGRDLPGPANPPGGKDPGPVQRQVAVSDAVPSPPRELLFSWDEPQRLRMESAARELARSELLRVGPARGLSVAAAPAQSPAKAAAQSPTHFPTQFEDEQFVPYDFDYQDYATVVFSARYRSSASGTASVAGTAGAPAAPGREQSWVVTIIARQDGDKLVKLYSAVSNPRELDLYPEMRLVDTVDPDGYGRFALLFREQKREGVSWLLGRVTGYELQTIFETAAR